MVRRRPLRLILLSVLLAGCGAMPYHRVQPGETLYAIGFRYGQDYHDIARWNGIAPPYVIQAGSYLRLTPPTTGAPVETRSLDAAPPTPVAPIVTAKAPAAPAGSAAGAPPSPPGPRAVSVAPPPAPAAAPAVAPAVAAWGWPAKGALLNKDARGLDIGGKLGQPIYAAGSGRVVYAGNGLSHYGNLIIIKHDENFLSAYAHNLALKVQEGDGVAAGQHIADMGSRNDGEVMLHFEIRLNGRPVDPLLYLPQRP